MNLLTTKTRGGKLMGCASCGKPLTDSKMEVNRQDKKRSVRWIRTLVCPCGHVHEMGYDSVSLNRKQHSGL